MIRRLTWSGCEGKKSGKGSWKRNERKNISFRFRERGGKGRERQGNDKIFYSIYHWLDLTSTWKQEVK